MDIDLTLAFQLGLFLVTLTILNRVLLRPLQQLFEARHHKMHVLKDETEKLRHEATADVEVYEVRMRAARDTGQREREHRISAAREEERRIINEMRAEITKSLAAARQQLAKAEQEATSSLQTQTQELVHELVSKVLANEVRS